MPPFWIRHLPVFVALVPLARSLARSRAPDFPVPEDGVGEPRRTSEAGDGAERASTPPDRWGGRMNV